MRYATLLLVCLIGLGLGVQVSGATPLMQMPCDPSVVMRTLASDEWPVAGAVRHDEFTAGCTPVVMTRAAVAAPRGFKPDELYVATLTVRQTGDRYSSREFVGRVNGVSYRYHFITTADGKGAAALGSVERPAISALGLTFASGVVRSDGIIRTLSCSRAAVRCELIVQRREVDMLTDLFTVRIDEKTPGGNVCVDTAGAAFGQPMVEVLADGKRLFHAPVGPDMAQVCMGPMSGRALDVIGAAHKLEFNAPREHTVIDAEGLKTAIDLLVFLFGHSVATDERVRREAAFAREAAKLR